MKPQEWLAVYAEPGEFAPLLAALAAAGLRAGWLELGAAAAPPAGLERAAAAGVLRAVAAGGGRVVSVKTLRGEPVAADLAREHFRGCRLVLVRGGADLTRLEPDGSGWRLTAPSGERRRWSTAELVRALRRPSLWR